MVNQYQQLQLLYSDPAQVLREVLVMVAEMLFRWTQCFIHRTCSQMHVSCLSSSSSKCFTKMLLPEEIKIVVKDLEEWRMKQQSAR